MSIYQRFLARVGGALRAGEIFASHPRARQLLAREQENEEGQDHLDGEPDGGSEPREQPGDNAGEHDSSPLG